MPILGVNIELLLFSERQPRPNRTCYLYTAKQNQRFVHQTQRHKRCKGDKHKAPRVNRSFKKRLGLAFGGIPVVDADVESQHADDPNPHLGHCGYAKHGQKHIWRKHQIQAGEYGLE